MLDFHQTADGDHDRVAALAADVMGRKPDLVVLTAAAAQLAKQLVESTPVVFVIADDPVRLGLVPSLARPGRATDVTSLNVELDAKRLEILKQALPGVTRVAVLTAPQDSAHLDRVVAIESAAKALGDEPHPQRGEGRRHPGGACDDVRAGDQSTDGPGAPDREVD